MTAWLFPTYQLDGFEWQHKLISLQENKFLPLLRVEKQSHAHLNYLLISPPYVSWSNENREKKFITRHSHYAFCVCVCVLSRSTPAVQAWQTENHTLAIIGDERNALILKIGTKVSTETRWLLHLLCGLGLFLALKLITLGLWSIWACHSFLCWAEHISYVLSECLLLLSKETAFEQLLPASLVPHLTCLKIIIFKLDLNKNFRNAY